MSSSAPSGSPTSGRRFELDALLDAARDVFAARGYSAAQIAEVAAAAGTTKPTLYARLGNKQQVYLAVVSREAALFEAEVAAAYTRGGDLPLEELAEIGMEPLFRFAADRPAGFEMLLRGDDVDGRIAAVRREVVDRTIRRLAAMIGERRRRFGVLEQPARDELLAAGCVGLARQICDRSIEQGGDLEEAWRLAASFAAGAFREIESGSGRSPSNG